MLNKIVLLLDIIKDVIVKIYNSLKRDFTDEIVYKPYTSKMLGNDWKNRNEK